MHERVESTAVLPRPEGTPGPQPDDGKKLPRIGGGPEVRGQLSALIIATYTWLTAHEFWRARNEPLVSRWPAITLFFSYGAMFLFRTPINAFVHGGVLP